MPMEAPGASAFPSTLYFFWSEEGRPDLDELRYRIAEEAEPDEEPDQDHDTEWFWSQMFRHFDSDCPILVWACRRIEGLLYRAGELRWRDADERSRAESCEWLVGVETLLDPTKPRESFQRQLRFGLVLCPVSPAVYDASSMRMRAGSAARLLAESETPPRGAELFATHAVGPRVPGEGCWVHSHGLRRASCPDLDLLAVPRELLPAAGLLLEGAAELLLAGARFAAGQAFELGPGLSVSWCPWRALAQRPGMLGGLEDRRGADNDHAGDRVVLVRPDMPSRPKDVEPRDALPRVLLEVLGGPSGALLLPRQETERMARLARERWPVFGMLFARHRAKEADRAWVFFVKLACGGPRGDVEHLWFEVAEIKPGRLRATLVNAASELEDVERGAEEWQPLERLTDWAIRCPLGFFHPESADYLWHAAAPSS